MTQETFLDELYHHLKTNRVQEPEEILEEYKEHFRQKRGDGYSEEEISARLGSAKEIAAQYLFAHEAATSRKSSKIVTGIGLAFADILMVMFFLILYAWVAVLAGLTLGSFGMAVVLIADFDLTSIIPYFPYLGKLLLGISTIALAFLSAAGTIYCSLYITQLARAYLRWHKKTMSFNSAAPPLSKHPQMKHRLRRGLRNTVLIAVVVFAVSMIAAMFCLFAYADFHPFWHYWSWFVS
jgi:uncharacterized membrane protein